jgi:hypothetical protein
MKALLPIFSLVLVATLTAATAREPKEETVSLFENRKVSIVVPDGFEYATGKDESGMVSVRLGDSKGKVSGEIKFLPDPEGRFANARARKELMHEMFFDYVSSSNEKAMQFEELEPKVGAGTYCVFTDAKLVGKAPYPPGEFLHLTAGLKAWPGVVAVFRVFSNETTSAEYQAILKTLRESAQERLAPLK